ncbi:unnamed protein product [Polarella glacialis]|uniref:Guanylate cyclase domain-containing protein n=1 Tax=Polarella glacialis TaxID=89957 RepID=A0A813DL21_POLGL|nr:unnamed protein product [Polarella glacialis]
MIQLGEASMVQHESSPRSMIQPSPFDCPFFKIHSSSRSVIQRVEPELNPLRCPVQSDAKAQVYPHVSPIQMEAKRKNEARFCPLMSPIQSEGKWKHEEGEPEVETTDEPNSFCCLLQCDSEHVIQEASMLACALLRYDRQDLVGRPILDLMPPAVALVHRKMFRDLRQCSPEDFSRAAKQIKSNMSKCREFILLDSHHDPVVCAVSVDLRSDLSSTVVLKEVKGNYLHTVPRGFEKFINSKPGFHVKEYDNAVCIMLDIAGSTEFACAHSSRDMARLLHNVYTTVNDVVARNAFPYAYIHEVVDDSVLILVNAGFMVSYPSSTALISFDVALESQRQVDQKLSELGADGCWARVGIGMGPISAGVVDGRNFRIFGETKHKAQRLESVCPRSKVVCCTDFLKLLCEQMQEQGFSGPFVSIDMPDFTLMSYRTGQECNVECLRTDLKGFGSVSYAVIDCPCGGKLLDSHLLGGAHSF